MPVGGRTKFRAIARVQPREETDEDLEDQGPTVCCRREGDTVVVARLGPGGEPAFESEQVFEFDRVFGSDSTYREIHSQELHFVVESALKGRDATLFVAGTSTCGKRHMVMGQPFLSAAEGGISGLAERIVGNLYMRDAREEWVLSVSMYSIFKETITDLLAPPGGGLQLSVVEDLHGNAVVLNLSDSSINNTADLLHLLRQSIQAREEIEEETNGRDGHSTLVLRISMQCVVGPDAATVHLVDLAGSDDLHLDDGLVPAAEEFDIVQHSLAMLGKVFSKMADGKEAIDYSGSTLTRLMKQYLEGASTVALLAVVSEQAASLSGVVEGLELAGKARAVFAQARPDAGPSTEEQAAAALELVKAAEAGQALNAALALEPSGLLNRFGAMAVRDDSVRQPTPPLHRYGIEVSAASDDDDRRHSPLHQYALDLDARSLPRALSSADSSASTESAAETVYTGEADAQRDDGGDMERRTLVACPKCARKFAHDRIFKHQSVCKGPSAVAKSLRAPRAPEKSTFGSEPAAAAAKRAPKGSALEPCPKCGRTFAPDRLEKHTSVCKGESVSRSSHASPGRAPSAAGAGSAREPEPYVMPTGGGGFNELGASYGQDAEAGAGNAPRQKRPKTPLGSSRSLGVEDGGGTPSARGPGSARRPGNISRGNTLTRLGGGLGGAEATEAFSQYRGKPGELQTVLEDVFRAEGGGTGAQVDEATLVLYKNLPLSGDEHTARRPAMSVTVAAETKHSVDDSFSIPAVVRSHDPRVLGLRVSHDKEAKRSHEILNGPDEMVAILLLINDSYSNEKFWDKKGQGGLNNPVVAMIHNMLVRIRRFHRMLEDTQMTKFADAVLNAMLRMYHFCTTVMTRSGRSALYNQAVKHLGEFYCYKFVSPPMLAAANIGRRGSPGSNNATLREGVAQLFALLTKGELNDASRAAVRESLRCVACSWAPPMLVVEVSLDAMTENLKNRDAFAMRTREMGLTVVYMVLSRHAWATVSRFFDSPDRPTGMPSKLHTLCACMGMARAEASKSPLSKALINLIGALLGAHVGVARLQETLAEADIDKVAAADIFKAAQAAGAVDVSALKLPATSRATKTPRKSPRPPSVSRR